VVASTKPYGQSDHGELSNSCPVPWTAALMTLIFPEMRGLL